MAKKKKPSRIVVIDNLNELNVQEGMFYMFNKCLVPCPDCSKCKQYLRDKCKFNKED